MRKKIFLILVLFAGSVLGGALAGYFIFQPEEVCAACAALPQQGSAVYACPNYRVESWPTGCLGHISGQNTCWYVGMGNISYTVVCPSAGYLQK